MYSLPVSGDAKHHNRSTDNRTLIDIFLSFGAIVTAEPQVTCTEVSQRWRAPNARQCPKFFMHSFPEHQQIKHREQTLTSFGNKSTEVPHT